jgi:hypothetical protein
MSVRPPQASWSKLDDFIEAFERARAGQEEVVLTEFLPDAPHPLYRGVLSELVRVDLEISWQRGQGKRVEDYRGLCPLIFEDHDLLEGIAFEEYRLRRQGGENPSAAEYQQRLGVCVGPARRPPNKR